MARLLALDVDGTMLNSDSVLTEPVKNSMIHLHEQGNTIVIVSGRNSLSVNMLLKKLGFKLSYISSGGAIVFNNEEKKVIGSYTLAKKYVRPIIEAALHADAGIFVELENDLLWHGSDEFLRWIEHHGILDMRHVKSTEELMSHDILKVALVNYHENHLPLESTIRSMNLPIHMAFSLPIYLEITAAGVNKGAALQVLLKSLGVDARDVIAVGDGENDISMFDVAGVSVAMGNANPKVKATADFVAPTNDEDGLAWVADHLSQMEVAR